MRYFLVLWGLIFLIGCGGDKASMDVQLLYGSEDSPVREIFNKFGDLISARVIVSYEELQPGKIGYIVEPPRASPTRYTVMEGQTVRITTFWHKAVAAGFNPFESRQVRIPNVPLNKRRFRMAIEFLLQYRDTTTGSSQYFVVAYACFQGPEKELSEEELRKRLKEGLFVYAGRTCGACPILEVEFAGQDAPGFTYEELSEKAPDICPPDVKF